MNNQKKWTVGAGCVVAVCIVAGVAKLLAADDKRLFERIRFGMTQSEVENLVGRPKLAFERWAFYGDEVRYEGEWQSPSGIYHIRVEYTNGCVAEKLFSEDQRRSFGTRAVDFIWNILTKVFG